jgi:hypothetical protein
VLCEVSYWGRRTEIRLQLTTRGTAGYGVLALITTADDGTASTEITAELRLPSGATYARRLAKGARYCHIGGQVTTEEISAALAGIEAVCAPWIELWQSAAERALPVDLDRAIDNLTGNVEGGSERYAHLRVKGWPAAELAAELHTARRRTLAGYVPAATQAGLAELLLVAARLLEEGERSTALQSAGEALLGASFSALCRWVAAPRIKRGGVFDENEAAEGRLAELVTAGRQKWEQLAEEAQASGDLHGAAVARERAEIKSVEGDLLLSGQHEGLDTKAPPPTDVVLLDTGKIRVVKSSFEF